MCTILECVCLQVSHSLPFCPPLEEAKPARQVLEVVLMREVAPELVAVLMPVLVL